ncbi:hypothetical protein ACQP08_30755 [Micromonospora zamorensis]|uniref:Flavin reductase n=1 Tax=Micromonospora zamorensis TaxID=709883 RepID=A0ABZ1PFJ7_9ACTN|nr:MULTISPECIES: hypothetical protein [Micromonospora]MBQ1035654.1 hypothetical protein [Micromonospora sp. C81]WSK51568.1 hypothetical protein OG423_15000 [Micromonospora zamorensis]WTE85891.1 hypothetical protein OHA01_25520 [Micromonospora zamorensis]SCG66193.1 hypothetical protein GA0070619_5320 [Micromonospora zamorensis]
MSRTAPDNRATTPCRPHLPLRPLWLCRVCAAPWPCPVARLTLRQEYADDRVGLSVYLCAVLHEAAADLYRLNPHDGPEPAALFTRFLGWARPRDTR